MSHTQFKITGMHCASCAVTIERELQKHPGVQVANVNYALSSVAVEHDETVKSHNLTKTVESLGYGIHEMRSGRDTGLLGADENTHSVADDQVGRRAAIALGLAVPCVILAMVGFWPTVQAILSTIVVLGSGMEFHRGAWNQLKHRRANMDSLISMGTLAALLFSWWQFPHGNLYFETAALITAFILLGRSIEARAKGKASEAISRLLEMGVKMAHRVKDGATEDVPVESLV
jgi:Cu+-exporting ATPase